MNFRFEETAPETLTLFFVGRLDMDSVAKLWQPCLLAMQERKPKELILDLKGVDYCDGAGIALFQVLEKQQLKNNHAYSIVNLQPDLQRLLESVANQVDRLTQHTPLPKENIPEHFGRMAFNIVGVVRENIIFLGVLAYHLLFTCFHFRKLRWHDFWRVFEDTGPKAFLIIALIGFLIGLISTFQAAPSFGQFGAQIFMVNLVGLGLVREMGPLLTAVLLAGRTASSFAAETGTMKINEELNALTTMGLNPVRFLIVPRILATMIITPLLEVFLIIFGLLGCYLVMTTLGYTFDAFRHQLYQSIVPMDFIGGLIKVFVFGWVIAGVGCLHGLKTRFGAQAVGTSTTQAVVSSLIMLVVVDGIFAVVYYVLGI
jgi:phospholipid/cholesterol/gamma-HCH transport system permease protein